MCPARGSIIVTVSFFSAQSVLHKLINSSSLSSESEVTPEVQYNRQMVLCGHIYAAPQMHT